MRNFTCHRLPLFQWAIPALLFLFSPNLVFSQEKTVEKANQAYERKQYAQAAALYEEAIAEKEAKGSTANTLVLKSKLAYCFRMNNKMDRAEKLYEEIVQHEQAKADSYLYYGETLLCNGKYEEAKKWFGEYLKIEPTDKHAALLLENCDKVKLIQPYFPFVAIQPFAHNSDADDNAPVAWQNGIVFSSDRKQGVKLMKEKSGWTGRDYLDLYFSAFLENGTLAEPQRFSGKLSETNKNTGNASFARDGKEVFFTRNDNVLNKANTYNLQLFRSENDGDDKWKKAEKLPFCTPNTSFMHPAISPDGKFLYFASNKKGEGGTDLFVSKRKGTVWGTPENLGPTVNTPANEGFPFMDENGRLYFCSKGHPGYGGFDVFFTEKDENGEWKTPQNLGQPINSPLDDISIFINDGGKSGMFTSSRGGGDDDIFLFKILDEAPPADSLLAHEPANTELPQEPVSTENTALPQEPAPGDEETTLPVSDPISAPTPDQFATTPEEIPVAEPIYQPAETSPEAEPAPVPNIGTAAPTELPFSGTEENVSSETPTPPATSTIPVEEPLRLPDTTEIEENPPMDLPPITASTPVPNATGAQAVTVAHNENTAANRLFTFSEFLENANASSLVTGQIYRLDGAVFDPNVWQLTPRIAKKLNSLAEVLREYPALQIELGAHTETPGPASFNLELSKNRANLAIEYLVKEGIPAARIKGVGYGETQPLNRCRDGVICTMEEHLFNQRLEIKVIGGGGQ